MATRLAKKRITLVGDKCCGKTSLSVCVSEEMFLEYNHPSQYVDDFSAEIGHGGARRELTILDTSSDGPSRARAYSCCDAVVICFDLTNSSSLESVESKWLQELEENCPGVPFIIAGCKRDLMCERSDGCMCSTGACCDLAEDDITALLLRAEACAYMECSALTGENVEDVFGLAVQCARHRRRNSAKKLIDTIKTKSRRLKKKLSIF